MRIDSCQICDVSINYLWKYEVTKSIIEMVNIFSTCFVRGGGSRHCGHFPKHFSYIFIHFSIWDGKPRELKLKQLLHTRRSLKNMDSARPTTFLAATSFSSNNNNFRDEDYYNCSLKCLDFNFTMQKNIVGQHQNLSKNSGKDSCL